MSRRILVTGAGGFIGHHLVKHLVRMGHFVRGVDLKHPEFEESPADDFRILDLRDADAAFEACGEMEDVYHLAADMGGIGFITAYHAVVARNNTLINVNMLDASHRSGIDRFLFSSSACVYPQGLQGDSDVKGLREEDAHPADPEEGYGWEKLYMEKLCQYYREDHGLDVRVLRFHNAYGPLGTFEGGREKAPAAICRKIAQAGEGEEIEIWGDGQQTRSFMYVDDCIEGLVRFMDSGYEKPVNLGTEELVTIEELVDVVCDIAGKQLRKRYDLTKPQGVRGRNSDNTLLRQVLAWEPQVPLREGIRPTYSWMRQQLEAVEPSLMATR